MAYNGNKLSMMSSGVIGQLNSFGYEGNDTVAAVSAAGFISDAKDRGMRVGDIVFVHNVGTGTSIRQCTAINATTGAATLGALT